MAYIIPQPDTIPIGKLHPRRVKMMMGEVTPAIPVKPTPGNGYLAGEFPGGTTTVEGAPVSATVRILYRPAAGARGDGVLVAEVQSAPDGTWLIQNLNESLEYDVVGRKEGFNDVIVAGVTPTSLVDITYAGAVVENETFTGALGYLEFVGGIPPYAASVVDPLPAGLFPVVDGRQLIIDGTTTDDDVFNSTVRITSSNGATKDVPVKLVVGFKAPANLEAETLEDAGTFSVVLTWEVTNTTQEVLVFKSTTPFDLVSMPAPIATLTGDAVSYTDDDDVIADDVFYYMAASVCESYTLYSDEVREVAAVADPHWGNVVSLLHFDGADGSTVFIDSSTSPKTVTPHGNVQISSAQSVFRGVSGYFDGSGDYLSLTASADFGFALADFTIEAFIYISGGQGTDRGITDFRSTGSSDVGTFFIDGPAGNRLAFWYGAKLGAAGQSLALKTWYHVALSRDNGVFRCYIDGVQDWAHARPVNFGTSRPLGIGGSVMGGVPGAGSSPFMGYIDELRITKGVARYTENFTPPTKPFPNK